MAEKSIEQRMAEAEMAKRKAQTPAPSYTPPSNPVPTPPSNNANPSNLPDTKIGENGQTLYRIGSTYGTYNPNQPNQAQQTQMANQVAQTGTVSDYYAGAFGLKNKAPTMNYYTPPKDTKGNIDYTGLTQSLGRTSMNTAQMSDGRLLDTTGWTAQQVHAATLWDDVAAGKRTAENAMAVLQGMGLDRYGNKVPGYGGVPTPSMSAQSGQLYATGGQGGQANFQGGVVAPPNLSGANTGVPSPNLTPEQRAYFDKAYGGFQNYVGTQQNRYNEAYGRDADLQRRLEADLARFGVSLNVPTPPQTAQTRQEPQTDYYALAQAEYMRELAQRENAANQQIQGLTSAFNRSNEVLRGNRTLEDARVGRSMNPFSGRTSYAIGTIGRERALADADAQGNFNTAIQGIQSGLAADRNAASQAIMARAAELERQAQEQAMREAELTGVYNGQQTLDSRNLSFNQNLALKEFNQQVAEKAWQQEFAEKQFTEEKAARLWEQTFKEKTFEQEVKQEAKRMGLDWAQLSQRQKEHVAEMAYKNKAFELDQKKFEASQNETAPTKIDAKTSTDNYNVIMEDLESGGVTRAQALQLLQANRDNLTNSDYTRMSNYINENF